MSHRQPPVTARGATSSGTDRRQRSRQPPRGAELPRLDNGDNGCASSHLDVDANLESDSTSNFVNPNRDGDADYEIPCRFRER